MSIGSEFPEVLLAARRGAEWAWSALYRGLAPVLLGYLRSSGAPEPEDLLGEVFLQVVRDLRTFSGGEPEFRSWVFAVAHHRLVDAVRARARRPGVDLLSDPPLDVPSGNVELEAVESLTNQEILRALASLTADQRAVLLLRVFGDLTLPQIANLLGKRLGAVKQLQRRGAQALGALRSPAPYPSSPSQRFPE
jgi:RNA polymerase sigma-70 factor (ECF subfamily)